MASSNVTSPSRLGSHDEPAFFSFGDTLRTILAPLASLKLTVALFAMAIVIVLAGTLAQVEKDIWPVINEYFRIQPPVLVTYSAWEWVTGWVRSMFVYVPFQIFFPPSFWDFQPPQVSGWWPWVPRGFWFPKGWLIGMGMAVNLLAAHLLRFKLQAKGGRLWGGLGVVALGVVVTALVIMSGSNKDGVQDETWLGYDKLWRIFQLCVAGVWLACVYGAVTVSRERKVEWWGLVILSGILGLITGWLVYTGDEMPLSPSSMRILWQLMKAEFAALILLAGCALLFRKRAGVVLLHAGVGLMMASEVLVGLRAVEEQMVIEEGQTVNTVQDIRHLELAVIDRSNPDHDLVVAVPLSRLEASMATGQPVRGDDLPFDVRMVKFLKNTGEPRRVSEDDENPATAGIGTKFTVDAARPNSGADSGGAVDSSAAYVKLTSKDGEDLGTWLVGRFLSDRELPQTVAVGDKSYDLLLRFKTAVKPYKFYLEDVRKEDYIGTSTPKDYSSVVHIIDEDGQERRVRIWMNNPLRYAGETFYQSGYNSVPRVDWDPETLDPRPRFTTDPQTGERSIERYEVTTLSVVRNTGWMIPYVACMIVATGMFAHFMIVLLRFLNRLAPQTGAGGWSSTLAWMVPLVLVMVIVGYFGSKAVPPKSQPSKMDLYAFGKIPIVDQGRPKPIDTLARNTLRSISGYQTYTDGETDTKEPAIRWLLDVIARPEAAAKHQIFRIDNDEVLGALKLERRKGHLYSVADLRENVAELQKQADQATKEPAESRSPFQRKILDLAERVESFSRLNEAFQPPSSMPPLPTPEEFKSAPFMAQQQIKQTVDFIRSYRQRMKQAKVPLAVPLDSESEEESGTTWEPYGTAILMAYVEAQALGQRPAEPTTKLAAIFKAYEEQDAREFNRQVNQYRAWFAENTPEKVDLGTVDFEAYFNHLAPFYYAAWFLYLPAFVFSALAWLGWSRVWNRAALWLICVTFLIHTFALIARMWISGRPPVTNLYSSAVFIGWGCVLLGMIFEGIFRLGVGNLVASVTGFVTLLIADFLSGSGDTFTVLQAVLDTQFWLATHVTCITLGYATTYVAGLLGLFYILHGLVAPWLRYGARGLVERSSDRFSDRTHATLRRALDPAPSAQASRDLVRMIYGTLCFSIFFSFVGTVLGGLWADDSWGRFWGWDPKENGALIIVIWNALVLHARWDGMVRDRGLAVLAIGGNIVTSWSWFGVNELGVGLHSYGFTEGVISTLKWFALSQLVVIAIGCLPRGLWPGLRRQPPDAAMEARV